MNLRAVWVGAGFAGFAALIALFAFGLGRNPREVPSPLIGKPAPAFELPILHQPDKRFMPADMKGKVWLLNVWASWCATCREEHPLLVALKERSGVDVYGVNYKDQTEAARRFLGRYGNPFTAVGADQSGRQAIEWGVYGMPETFVVSGRGEITYKHVGPMTPESVELKVIPAIEAARRATTAVPR